MNMMGRGIMKLKIEFERLNSICNGVKSIIEIMRHENKMVENCEICEIIEEKRIQILNTKFSKKEE